MQVGGNVRPANSAAWRRYPSSRTDRTATPCRGVAQALPWTALRAVSPGYRPIALASLPTETIEETLFCQVSQFQGVPDKRFRHCPVEVAVPDASEEVGLVHLRSIVIAQVSSKGPEPAVKAL